MIRAREKRKKKKEREQKNKRKKRPFLCPLGILKKVKPKRLTHPLM
jgi:hypothetical protein